MTQPDFWQQQELQRQVSGEGQPQNTPMLIAVRVRPLSRDEADRGEFDVVRVLEARVVVALDPHEYDPNLQPNRSKEKKYAFDLAFNDTTTQAEVFRSTTRGLIAGVLDGFNASVFAYGATGAGKTYTMLGALDSPGVMVLTLNDMFRRMRTDPQFAECAFRVRLSYLEIYNEVIKDLLNPADSSVGLPLNEDPARGMIVAGMTEYEATSASQVLQLLHRGNMARAQEPTAANKTSSRSHAILQVTVEQSERTAHLVGAVKYGKLSLIDLAGSERASKTENTGLRLKEGANINRSLLALGNCINALADGRAHIPYRDSKMTRLLKDSLGGNCRTVMIANVSPSSAQFEETVNTLKYANRAKNLKTKVASNVASVTAHVAEYQRIIVALRKEIAELKQAQAQSMNAQAGPDPKGEQERPAEEADRQQARALQQAILHVCAERRQVLQQLDLVHGHLVNRGVGGTVAGGASGGADAGLEQAEAMLRLRLEQNEQLALDLQRTLRVRVRDPDRIQSLELLFRAQFLDMARAHAAYELQVRQSYEESIASSQDLPPRVQRAMTRMRDWCQLRAGIEAAYGFHNRMAQVSAGAPGALPAVGMGGHVPAIEGMAGPRGTGGAGTGSGGVLPALGGGQGSNTAIQAQLLPAEVVRVADAAAALVPRQESSGSLGSRAAVSGGQVARVGQSRTAPQSPRRRRLAGITPGAGRRSPHESGAEAGRALVAEARAPRSGDASRTPSIASPASLRRVPPPHPPATDSSSGTALAGGAYAHPASLEQVLPDFGASGGVGQGAQQHLYQNHLHQQQHHHLLHHQLQHQQGGGACLPLSDNKAPGGGAQRNLAAHPGASDGRGAAATHLPPLHGHDATQDELSDEGTHLAVNSQDDTRRSHPRLPSTLTPHEADAVVSARRGSLDVPRRDLRRGQTTLAIPQGGLAGRAAQQKGGPVARRLLPPAAAKAYHGRQPQPPQRAPAGPIGGRLAVRGPGVLHLAGGVPKNPSRSSLSDASRRPPPGHQNPTAAARQRQSQNDNLVAAYGQLGPKRTGGAGVVGRGRVRSTAGSGGGGGGPSTAGGRAVLPAIVAR